MTMNEKYIALGLNIARLRKMARFSQAELAECVGISTKHLSNLESPGQLQGVSLAVLFRICDALGCSMIEIFQGL